MSIIIKIYIELDKSSSYIIIFKLIYLSSIHILLLCIPLVSDII